MLACCPIVMPVQVGVEDMIISQSQETVSCPLPRDPGCALRRVAMDE